MEILKQRAKSKGYYLAMAVTALGAVQTALPGVQEQLKDYYGFIVMGVGVAIAIIREMTNKPLSEK